jgi:hypothetical protein|tara:strand:+ start:1194 stop:1859 length:666 start_codon:yes stop_codon:yes gene_type:complete
MSNYFSYLPNFDYVNRIPGEQNISSYIEVKNLFKNVKLNSEIFQELANFEKYTISGNDRPDVVAQKVYGRSEYDWIILLANNIINIQDEWPMSNQTFEKYMDKKYGAENYNSPHHYETIEIKDFSGNLTILKKGLEVPSDFSISYFDMTLKQQRTLTDVKQSISNYEYEFNIQNEKRNIFILRDTLIQIVVSEIQELMAYPIGSSQYVNRRTVKGENINLY